MHYLLDVISFLIALCRCLLLLVAIVIQISSLANSIRSLANMEDPIGCVVKRTEVIILAQFATTSDPNLFLLYDYFSFNSLTHCSSYIYQNHNKTWYLEFIMGTCIFLVAIYSFCSICIMPKVCFFFHYFHGSQ